MAGRPPGDREPKGTAHDGAERQSPVQSGRQMPSQEALDALGELVQRARHAEASRAPLGDDVAAHEVTAPSPFVVGDGPRPAARYEQEPSRRRPVARGRRRHGTGAPSTPRWLVRGVVALATFAVLVVIADLVLVVGGQGAALRNVRTPPSAAGTGASSTTVPNAGPTTPPGSDRSTTTTAAPSGGAAPASPQLTSLSPAQGKAGTVIVLDGKNFFSPANGVVLARVDGQPAPTDCRTQTSCQVTIPNISAPPTSVTITVTTDSGTSNALTFRYS